VVVEAHAIPLAATTTAAIVLDVLTIDAIPQAR
jgi:hypothetical protein